MYTWDWDLAPLITADPPTTGPTRYRQEDDMGYDECEHGSLRRSCDVCDLIDVVHTMTVEIAALRAEVHRLADVEQAARAVLHEVRSERACCHECAEAGKDGWWTPAELRLAAAINGDR